MGLPLLLPLVLLATTSPAAAGPPTSGAAEAGPATTGTASAGTATPKRGPGSTVVVRVHGFRSSRGFLECSLYAGPKGFPTDDDRAIAQSRTRIAANRTAECRFEGVVPGTYAVGLMHDENGNGKFDTFLGLPREGYGFSNNAHHALRAPSWDECKFDVADGRERILEVKVVY